ncbi:MAG: efflux RND transporter periplasmic adaptor subunit [Gemmatimonadaceae bacterium]|nr:efflux RND transporter periplasmic adaptor subunit [Gemmatimonadaceae bacterium]
MSILKVPVNRTLLLALAIGSAVAACKKEEVQVVTIRTAPVERRTIVLDATASGAVEPINVVEVKSKSSGQIVQMTVETGSMVNRGDLLVQLETRDVQNQFDQAKADLNAAEARLQVSEAQKKRADDLFSQRITTAQEHETAQLDFANAQAAVIRARTSLDLAQQRLDDATVRAPNSGTIIEKTVSLGQVITSATSGVGGGTTLLKMADLTKVRMRALFNETDIGSVSPRQQATVTVDAYPDRPFHGVVEKIEPQAVIQQSVTMFPVLINLENREGLLRPGMNGEASVLVDRRENVLSVPNDAIRTSREAPMLAGALGLTADSVEASIQAQMAQFGGMRQGQRNQEAGLPSMGGPPRGMRMGHGDVALDQQGERRQAAPVSEAECAKVREAMAKKPDVAKKLADLRQKMMAGEIDFAAMRDQSQALYREAGVDPMAARGCMGGTRQGGTPANGAGAAAGNGGAPQSGRADSARGTGTSGTRGDRSATPERAGETSQRGRSRTAVVFIAVNGVYSPKVVQLGIANFDYTEVLTGLKDGDQVALLATAALQVARDSSNARFRQMTGGGAMPGMQRQQGGGTAAPPPRP